MVRSEPCDRCGDETAVGSSLFPGRYQGTRGDGANVFRCGGCAARDIEAHERDELGTSADGDWLTKSIYGANVRMVW